MCTNFTKFKKFFCEFCYISLHLHNFPLLKTAFFVLIVSKLYINSNKEIPINRFDYYDNINFVTFKENGIDFSYNIIKIKDLKINDLNIMKSKVAKEIIKIRKNKFVV